MNRQAINAIVALATLAACLAASSPASAEMLYLKCGAQSIVVDVDKSTVGGQTATISPSAIDWTSTSRNPSAGLSVVATFHIDRVAGTMSQSTTFYMPDGSAKFAGTNTYPCATDNPPATKF